MKYCHRNDILLSRKAEEYVANQTSLLEKDIKKNLKKDTLNQFFDNVQGF